ncbi:MAG: hypothetical protein J6L87_08545 [Clostridia bacterium]|nr:hypothetical protein [Clostridia bacterium]
MLPITTIAILVIAGLGALFLLIGFLVGTKRGLAKQGLALGLILLTIPVAIFAAKLISGIASERVWPMVMEAIPEEYLSALESSPSLMSFVEALPAAVIAPFVFVVAYLLLLSLFKIIYAIVGRIKVFQKENFAKPAVSTWVGGALGLVAAAAVFVCFMMPAVGYLNVASTALSTLTDEDAEAPIVAFLPALNGTLSTGESVVVDDETEGGNDTLEMLAEINSTYVQPLAGNPLISGINACGGKLMFRSLTSSRINNVSVDVLGELTGVAETVVKLEPMLGVEVKDFGTEQADAIRSVVDDIDQSDILKNIFSEVLSSVATTWQKGESFLGISSPVTEETSPMLKPVLEELVDVLATSTADNIAGDLYTIADIFGTLAKNDIFTLLGGEMTTDDLVYTLSADGMLAEVLVAFKSNEHMEELIPVVINMGMEAIGDMLGMPENDEAVYESLMGEVTTTVNDFLAKAPEEIETEEIATSLQDTAAKYGITFSDTLADFYAQSIVNDFAPGETYTEAEVVGYFAEVAAYLATKDGEQAPLSGETTAEDGLTNLGMILLDSNKNNGNGNGRVKFTPPAEPPVIEETEKNTTAMLSGEKPLEHSLVTKEALKMDKTVIKDMSTEQVKNDGEKITETLVALTDILAVLQPEEEPAEPDEDEDLEEGDEPDEETKPEEPKPEENKPGLGLDTISALNDAGLGAALGNLGSTNLLKDAAPQLVVGALQAGGVVLPKEETKEIIEIIKKDNEANTNKPAEEDCSKGHKFGRWETVSVPTCTEMGVEEHTCKVCGLKATRSINAKGHSLTGWAVETAATCTAEGVNARSCKSCSYKETKPIAAKGHVAGAWIIDTNATYDADGSKHKECTVCGVQLESSIVPKLSHTYVSTVTDPTCTEQGYTTHVCSDCGHSYKDDYTPTVSHTFGKWNATTPATCTEDGISERVCSVCAFTETKTVKATGHKYATTYTTDVEPTATTVGSKSRHCKGCDDKIDVTEVPATGNTTVLESLVNSTADLVSVIDHIKAGNLTEEELIADFDKLFAGLSPSTAKIVANVVNPSLINNFAPGLKGEQSAQLSKLIRNVVLSIADAEVDDYSKESALMSDMLHMAMNAKDSEATRLFNSADGTVPGKMSITAEAFVGKVLSSEIISVAIESANLGSDPFGVSGALGDADVADFVAGANALFAENSAHHKNAERVLNFATLVGITLTYDEAAHTFTQVAAE